MITKMKWNLQWWRMTAGEKALFAQATAQYLEYLTTFRSLSGDTPKTLDQAIQFLREKYGDDPRAIWRFERILPAAIRQMSCRPGNLQEAIGLL